MKIAPSLATLALGSALVAQGPQVTLPSAVATAKPATASWSSSLFYSTTSTTTLPDSRTQTLYDVSDITPNVAVWNSLSVRRPHGLGNANPAFTANATITLSHNTGPSANAGTTFASNHGATPTVVLSGQISLPARTNPGAWPAVWETPFPFTTPYVFAKIPGGSLVVDVQQNTNNGGAIWYVEATGVDTGTRVSNPSAQPNCKFSTGTYNNSISHRNPYVGGSWFVTYFSCAPNLVGYGAIGASGAGGTWGGIPLPIDLTPYNAPGCSWSVSADFVVPLTTNASGSGGWTAITIPNLPGLVGQSFYDHALFLDPPANAWGVVTTWSSKWTIGSNTGAPAATVYATGNSASAATGTLQKGFAASMQFN